MEELDSSTIHANLELAYDLEFAELIVNYVQEHDIWAPALSVTRIESQSRIPRTRPGVTMLLGRNGSGKSRFLRALSRLSSLVEGDPHVVCRFAVPSDEELSEYLDVVDDLRTTTVYLEEVSRESDVIGIPEVARHEVDRRFFGLRFLGHFISSITKPAYDGRHNFEWLFGTSSSAEILEHFGFSPSAVDGFKKRQSAYHDRDPDPVKNMVRNEHSIDFRDYFPEFFLFMIQGSWFNRGEDEGTGTWYDCRRLLADPVERVVVMEQLRWSFERATSLDVRVGSKGLEFSVVVDADESDSVARDIEERRHEAIEYDNLTFPFDLWRTDQRLSTAFRPFLSSDDSWYSRFSPFEVVDLTFASRETSIEEIRAVFHGLLTVTRDGFEESSYVVTVTPGPQVEKTLRSTVRLLRETDIDVVDLRIRPADEFRTGRHHWGPSVSSDGTNPRTHELLPIVEWKGSTSDEWRSLHQCSDGQLDVIRILVRLVEFTTKDHGSQVKVLVVDEFNRHLHPTVSQVLLDQMDRFGRKYGLHVVASTHSFGALEAHKYPHIIAERDGLGRHRLEVSSHSDSVALATRLGVSERMVTELKKVILVVEGRHDEVVFETILGANPNVARSVEVVNLDGLYGLTSTWRTALRHESADVLLVYDKRNVVLEEAWIELVSHAKKAKVKENLLTRFPSINDQLESCQRRISEARKAGERLNPGETETKNICHFLIEVVRVAEEMYDVQGAARMVGRVHLHGIDLPDVVDALPIGEFPPTRPFTSWATLRADESNSNLGADAFKRKFRITLSAVERAAKKSLEQSIHPELQRVFARIVGIMEVREDPHDPRLD